MVEIIKKFMLSLKFFCSFELQSDAKCLILVTAENEC